MAKQQSKEVIDEKMTNVERQIEQLVAHKDKTNKKLDEQFELTMAISGQLEGITTALTGSKINRNDKGLVGSVSDLIERMERQEKKTIFVGYLNKFIWLAAGAAISVIVGAEASKVIATKEEHDYKIENTK